MVAIMGSTDSNEQPSNGSVTDCLSHTESVENGSATRLPNIFLNGKTSNHITSNGNGGLMMNLDASTQTQVKTAGEGKSMKGYVASIILLPMLIPITLIYLVLSQIFNKISTMREEPFAEPPPIDTGYRCKRHSICMPASESLSHLELLRHDSRELLLQGGDSTPDLRHEIRPELLDAATPLSRSRRGSFSRRQTLRRNSSMPREMHRQPKYITPDNVLWQLMMLPILMPLWIIDIVMSILTSPLTVLRRIMTYTEALPTTPPPIRRRGSMSLHSGGGHKPHVYPVSPMAMNMYSGSPPSPPLGGPLYLDPSLY